MPAVIKGGAPWGPGRPGGPEPFRGVAAGLVGLAEGRGPQSPGAGGRQEHVRSALGAFCTGAPRCRLGRISIKKIK